MSAFPFCGNELPLRAHWPSAQTNPQDNFTAPFHRGGQKMAEKAGFGALFGLTLGPANVWAGVVREIIFPAVSSSDGGGRIGESSPHDMNNHEGQRQG